MKKFIAEFNKQLIAALFFILGSTATGFVSHFLQDNSPQILVRQFYNSVEPAKAVPTQIGGLVLDYKEETEKRHLYLVEVSNIGRGPEEDLRLQVQFPKTAQVTYHEPPDFRVYRAEELALANSSFFMNLKQFPVKAVAPVSFEVGELPYSLCDVHIKVAGKAQEGQVEKIKGLICGSM